MCGPRAMRLGSSHYGLRTSLGVVTVDGMAPSRAVLFSGLKREGLRATIKRTVRFTTSPRTEILATVAACSRTRDERTFGAAGLITDGTAGRLSC
jgi:hypothetical protein